MGIFNFMETFFFISLAITFVLIMMLVYHFKERMSVLEKKTDTMFEIVNNIVKELNFIRTQSIPISNNIPLSNIFSQFNNNKIIVSEDESDSDTDSSDNDDSNNDDLETSISWLGSWFIT